jgi:transglutaminase/protease-like cytokinesis protein 3
VRFSIIIGILLFFSIDPINAQTEDFIGIDFSKADSVARIHSGHPLSNLKGLADSLTNPFSTDVEKFRSIYTWVCLNIENDYNLFTRNQQKRKKLKNKEALASWNAKLHDMVFKNLIEKKRTVCTGYALLIKKLANYAGIDCEIVDGYGRTAQANI